MILYLGVILISLTNVLAVNNRNFQEGESCQLPDENPGVCRKILDCPQIGSTPRSLCKSSGYVRVICCPPPVQTLTPRNTTTLAQTMCQSVPIHIEPRMKPHIVGNAEIAEVAEFPFMGLLMYRDKRLRCGAVLITSKLLLTAAHCFRQGIPIQVRLGTNSATDVGAEPYGVARTVTHPDYKWKRKRERSIWADIAIVELTEEVAESNIAPLCLYGSLEDLPPTENLTIVGWGVTDTGTEATADTLMKGTVRTFDHSECQASYKKIKKSNVTSSHICAQGDVDSKGVHTDSCWGDSGGPLVKLTGSKYYLIGIISSGQHCGLKEYPGIYTRVASYLNWITNEIQTKFS